MRLRTRTRPRDFRETLIAASALEKLFERLNAAIEQARYLAMGGQIVDASTVEAPKQRNTKEEKADIKAGRVPKAWQDKPHKLRQKDMDGRWTCKRGGCGLMRMAGRGKADHSGLGVQEPCQHRSASWPHSEDEGHGCCRP